MHPSEPLAQRCSSERGDKTMRSGAKEHIYAKRLAEDAAVLHRESVLFVFPCGKHRVRVTRCPKIIANSGYHVVAALQSSNLEGSGLTDAHGRMS